MLRSLVGSEMCIRDRHIWSSDDGKLLRSLRENANLNYVTLAQMSAISIEQLKQLEEGGSSSFYTEGIKTHMGKKVLKKLGCDVVEPVINNLSPLISEDIVEPKESQENIQEKTIKSKYGLYPKLISIDGVSIKDKIQITKSFIILSVIFILFLIFFIYKPRDLGKSTRSDNKSEDSIEVVQVLSSAAIKTHSSDQKNSISNDKPIEQKTLNASQEIKFKCNWSTSSFSISPKNPTKEGKFVFFKATQDVSFCIKDKLGQIHFITLQANQSKLLNGLAPFTIKADDFEKVNIFFQGEMIRPPKDTGNQVTLNSIEIKN